MRSNIDDIYESHNVKTFLCIKNSLKSKIK